MGLFAADGYAELRPSLVSSSPPGDSAGSSGPRSRAMLALDGEGGVCALRSDFTVALASLFVARFPDPPRRVSYAGPVFREPRGAWEAAERFEVGCEHTGPADESAEADHALYTLLAKVPDALGLLGGTLKLGHAGLVRRPLDEEGIVGRPREGYVRALSNRAHHRIDEALSAIAAPVRDKLARHAKALFDDTPDESPYRARIEVEIQAIEAAATFCATRVPSRIRVRKDHADVTGIDFYTGPTFALWAPHASAELLAGGRYDALYPSLGRPWCAAGFCVRLSRLLDLREAHPEVFEETAP